MRKRVACSFSIRSTIRRTKWGAQNRPYWPWNEFLTHLNSACVTCILAVATILIGGRIQEPFSTRRVRQEIRMRRSNNHSRISTGQSDRPGRRARLWLAGTAAIGVLLGPALNSALAETQVSGTRNDLQIRVEDGSLREILAAISDRFQLTYKFPANIGEIRNLTGVYSGTLSQVLAHILEGNDYIAQVSNRDVKVIVLRRSDTTGQPSTSQTVAANESPTVPSGSSQQTAAKPPILPSSNTSPPPLSTYISATKAATTGQAADP